MSVLLKKKRKEASKGRRPLKEEDVGARKAKKNTGTISKVLQSDLKKKREGIKKIAWNMHRRSMSLEATGGGATRGDFQRIRKDP